MNAKTPGWARMVLLTIPIQIAVVSGLAWVLSTGDTQLPIAESAIERPAEKTDHEQSVPMAVTRTDEEVPPAITRPKPLPRSQVDSPSTAPSTISDPIEVEPPSTQVVAVASIESAPPYEKPGYPVNSSDQPPQDDPGASATKPTVQPSVESLPKRTIRVGAYVSGQSIRVLDDYENAVGRHQDIFHYFRAWGENLDSALPLDLVARGTIPMITWEPFGYSLDGMIEGQYDQYINDYAEAINRVPGTVYLRPLHEMNGDWYPWGAGHGGNTPAKFKDAFRHVADLVHSVAPNAEVVWSPNHVSSSDGTARSIPDYYPGDAYVDRVAIDGYNWGNSWASFDQIFGAAYKEITAITNKTIMVGETSSAESGGDKALWIRNTFDSVSRNYPNITTVLWFNADKERDWRVSSSSSTLEAFREAIRP